LVIALDFRLVIGRFPIGDWSIADWRLALDSQLTDLRLIRPPNFIANPQSEVLELKC
jgi:hypothetical protein